MDSLDWYKGKRLRDHIDNTMSNLTITHLAVVMILAARDQNKTLEEIVQELILANDYDAATTKLDKDKTIRDLGGIVDCFIMHEGDHRVRETIGVLRFPHLAAPNFREVSSAALDRGVDSIVLPLPVIGVDI